MTETMRIDAGATITGSLDPGNTVTLTFSHGRQIDCEVIAVEGDTTTLRWETGAPILVYPLVEFAKDTELRAHLEDDE